ncbi:hypothetical protein MMC12_005809 [Toensbergia leucococca]|nr:hypothetical protein [Toensbergia leucococca]
MAELYPSPSETELGFEDVFHPRDAIARELDGSISPPREGTRRINKRRLKISSEDYPEDSNLALAFSELDIDETMVIPEVLFSKQTYEYCGFTSAVASRLWELNEAARGEFPEFDDPNGRGYFLSFAFANIDEVPEPSSFDDQGWKLALQNMGLNEATQDIIMLEEFSDLRRTEGARYWGKDMVNLRLCGLEQVKRASWERLQQSDRRIQRAGREGRPLVGSRMSGMATETASCAKANTPGSTVLWKGLSLAHTVGLFNLDNTVLDFTTIISNPPSDFSIGGGYHWVLDKEIAIRYVKWAKNKSDVGECVILRLEIPNNLIESLEAPILRYPSDIWKRFVHSCRRRRALKDLRYLLHKTLLIGHIATGCEAIANLQDWRDVSIRHTLKTSGNGIATQYIFSNEAGLDFLEENCSNSLIMYRSGDDI